MAGFEERDSLLQNIVDRDRRGPHRRLGRELRECADAALQAIDLVHHDLGRLFQESCVALAVPRQHLLHRQPDRRERVLHFVRHFARQRLPARQLREIHQPIAILLHLLRHVIERPNGAADLVVAIDRYADALLATG